jgi:serine/threonine-protein kinase
MGYVVGGVGIVGVGLGSFFGLQAVSKWSSAKNDCGGGCPDGSAARKEKSDAVTDATISTVGFAAGGVAIAGAIVLLVTAPSSTRIGGIDLGPFTTHGGAGLAASGVF